MTGINLNKYLGENRAEGFEQLIADIEAQCAKPASQPELKSALHLVKLHTVASVEGANAHSDKVAFETLIYQDAVACGLASASSSLSPLHENVLSDSAALAALLELLIKGFTRGAVEMITRNAKVKLDIEG
ncbi:hypothetical protein [Aestuariivirga litoralis]|uniref:hypothetical protein n=1 Tax=Aestuariivirga litoralis TaxID=2650924 RepID=UPI0018C5B7C8|nr:hypothetical protein [Aestuariivirga litoralis]MBG1232989.1 hypothetical protein [Aestuariivirga litoralis]